MGNRTIPLAEVHAATAKYLALTEREAAVRAMCEWIQSDSHKKRSRLPALLVQAFSLSKAKFGGSRLSKNKRAEKVFRALAAGHLKAQGQKDLTDYMARRIWALTWLPFENKITGVRRRDKLYLANSNDLRVSLPTVYEARYKGKRALLLLYNDAKAPLRRRGELTDAAQTIWGAFASASDGRYLCDDLGTPKKFVSEIHYLLVVDVTRIGIGMRAALLIWPLMPDLSLAAHKVGFSTKLDFLCGLYSEACQRLGMEETRHRKVHPLTLVTISDTPETAKDRSAAG